MIKGGYYIKARKIQESEIAHASPSVREIWDWLLQQANHKTNNVCERGQCVRTYKDIMEGLAWYAGWRKESYSKSDCENAMKFLRSRSMITTRKTTRGLVITIVNYGIYQNPKNYESHTEYSTEYQTPPQHTATINKNDKNDKNKHIAGASPAQAFSLSQEIQKMEENSRRDINVIALYFEERKPNIKSRDQLQVAIKRHLRPAKMLVPFSDEQILGAVTRAKTITPEWTLETLVKVLSK